MKKTVLAAIMILTGVLTAQTAIAPAAGNGTESSPYEIATWENLYWLSQNQGQWTKHYIQTADIDLSTAVPAIATWNGGTGWTPIGNDSWFFEGTYDGKGKTVSGPYWTGGFVGYSGGTTSNCFWDTESSGVGTSFQGTGKTTAEMKNITTFTGAGWDIAAGYDTGHEWNIYPQLNSGYPYLSALLQTKIHYVNGSASGANDGSSWTDAFTSLQSELEAANYADAIWVAAGTYKPSVEDDGTVDEPRKFTFGMKEGVKIYGGFAGDEDPSVFDLDDRDFITNETVLSGDLNGNDEFEIGVFNVYQNSSGTDNCYSVLFNLGNAITSTAVLDGFTISGGNANAGFPGNAGAGMVTDGTPVLRNLIFTHNYSVSGGALFLLYAGGGDLSNLSFIENSGGEGSGGLYLYELSSPAVLTNALFLNNRGVHGGGISNSNSTLTVNNATFSRNEVWGNGGAVENRNNGTLTLNNCIIWNNIAYENGSEIYHDGNATTLNNCCYKNETGDIYGKLTLGSGNITSDPKFVDAEGGDLRLFGNSPGVNTGNNSYNSENSDLRGETRIQNTTIDMGAYEWTSGTDPENRIIYVNDDASGTNDGTSWTDAFVSLQSALDTAVSGDDIWIAGGTYKPVSAYSLTNTLRYYHFELINNVGIYGGFAGTETSVDQRTDYGYGGTNETILSGDIGTIGDNSDNCYHIIYNLPYSINNSAILDGVTVSGGNANLWENTELKRGGGMYMPQNSPIIRNVIFAGNYGIYGGAVFNMVSSGIYSNCLFFNNSAVYGGASMTYSSTALTFDNCTFYGNSATGHGGGVDNWNSAFSYNNCIFWGNTSATGNQIYAYGSSTITLNTSCYSSNANDIAVETGASIITTNNNITSNPLFVYADNHDYRLYGNSPAVNAGSNSYNATSTDIRGKDRIQNTTIDMGAYEWTDGTDPISSVLFVNDDASGSNNGSSWEDAFTSLQSALDVAVSGNEIWVAKGTYTPSAQVGGTGSRYAAFQMKNNVKIYGGFAGTETAVSQRDYFTNETILSGDINGDDVVSGAGASLSFSNNEENSYHLFYHDKSGVNSSAVLDGFTISGGNANGGGNEDYGAGIYNDQCNPTLNNIIFKDNQSATGVLYFYDLSTGTQLSNLIFENNDGGYYGALYIEGSAGISVLKNALLINNKAEYGGGLYNSDAPTTIINATFSGNYAVSDGGGIYNSSGVLTLNNCIIWGNTTAGEGNEIYYSQWGSSSTTLNNSCYQNSSNDIYGDLTFGSGNITSDPLFVNETGKDFRLFGISPSVNSGENSYNSSVYDLRGESRIQDAVIDIGCYEWTSGTDPYEMAVPGDIVITAGISSALIEWTAVPDAASYKIYRSTDPYAGFEQIGTTGTNSYTDSEVLAGRAYFYYVTSVSGK